MVKSKWFKPTIIVIISIAAIVAVVVFALSKDKDKVGVAETDFIKTSEDKPIATTLNDEELKKLNGSKTIGVDIIESELDSGEYDIESSDNEAQPEDNAEESDVEQTPESSEEENQSENNTEDRDADKSSDSGQGEDQDAGETEESAVDPDPIAMYKDPDHEEDDPAEIVGAKWVN